jgi:hypothetical protein
LKITVARWGLQPNPRKIKELIETSGSDSAAVTVDETRNQIIALVQLDTKPLNSPIENGTTDSHLPLGGLRASPEGVI